MTKHTSHSHASHSTRHASEPPPPPSTPAPKHEHKAKPQVVDLTPDANASAERVRLLGYIADDIAVIRERSAAEADSLAPSLERAADPSLSDDELLRIHANIRHIARP